MYGDSPTYVTRMEAVCFSSSTSSACCFVVSPSSCKRWQSDNTWVQVEWQWLQRYAQFLKVKLLYFFSSLQKIISIHFVSQYILEILMVYIFHAMFIGVGIATMVMVLYYNIYYCIIVAWSLYYFIASFVSIPDVPWNTCGKI